MVIFFNYNDNRYKNKFNIICVENEIKKVRITYFSNTKYELTLYNIKFKKWTVIFLIRMFFLCTAKTMSLIFLSEFGMLEMGKRNTFENFKHGSVQWP